MTGEVAVSIVIISHDHDAMLAGCIASLAPILDGTTAEIIVIDNKQDGRVAAALAGLPVRLIENERPRGFAANANRGLHAASGRHLLLLNPDTQAKRGRLADAIAFLDRNPRVGILGCRLLNPDGSPQQSYRRFPTVPFLAVRGLGVNRWPRRPAFYRHGLMEDVRIDGPQPVDWIFGAFMLMRRSELLGFGGMDEGFHLYYEDVDLCYRYRRRGLATYVFPDLELVHAHLRTSARQPFGQVWRWHVKSAARYFWKSRYLVRPVLGPRGRDDAAEGTVSREGERHESRR